MPNADAMLVHSAASLDIVASTDAPVSKLDRCYQATAAQLLASSGPVLDGQALHCFETFRQEVRTVKALCRDDDEIRALTSTLVDGGLSPSRHQAFLRRLSDIEVQLEYQRALGVIGGTINSDSLSYANHDYRSILQPEIQLTRELLEDSSGGRSVMVGAGPLPISSIFFSDELGARRCLAIDNDPVAAVVGTSVLGALGNRTMYLPQPGQLFAFRPGDVPLVATMVTDRVDVLRHMHQCGVQNVLVRNVFGAARLCYSGSSIEELESTGYRVSQLLPDSDSVLVTALHLERVP